MSRQTYTFVPVILILGLVFWIAYRTDRHAFLLRDEAKRVQQRTTPPSVVPTPPSSVVRIEAGLSTSWSFASEEDFKKYWTWVAAQLEPDYYAFSILDDSAELIRILPQCSLRLRFQKAGSRVEVRLMRLPK